MMILNLGIPAHDYPEMPEFGGTLVICGGAACVWDDLAAIYQNAMLRPDEFDYMTVNDITMHFPGKIRHAYSNDHEDILRWIHCRRDTLVQEYGEVGFAHSRSVWPWPGHGSSGLGAVYTGLALGYDRIILCGMPMDDSPHYFDPPWAKSQLDKEDIAHWETARDKVFDGKVKSMSGRTRDILGN